MHADLADGQTFSFVVTHTDTAAFTYTIETIDLVQSGQQKENEKTPSDTVVRTRQHDKKYAGYVLHIAKKTDAVTTLSSADVTLDVTTKAWNVGFAGGFTVSSLTDRAYAVVPDSVLNKAGQEVPVQRFERQKTREDRATLGIGAFVDAWNARVPWLALGFGLGINQNQNATYYVGPSIRLGDQASFHFGPMWGATKSPPAGVQEGQIVTDPNVANNVGSRVGFGWFAALSYSFISGADKTLGKPFLGQDAPTVNQVTKTAPTPPSGTGEIPPAIAPTKSTAKISADANTKLPTTAKAGATVKIALVYTPTPPRSARSVQLQCSTDPNDSTKVTVTPRAVALPDSTGRFQIEVVFKQAGTVKIVIATGDGSNALDIAPPLTIPVTVQ
jgi:hypothetical protein